jgi:hypothetical protein
MRNLEYAISYPEWLVSPIPRDTPPGIQNLHITFMRILGKSGLKPWKNVFIEQQTHSRICYRLMIGTQARTLGNTLQEQGFMPQLYRNQLISEITTNRQIRYHLLNSKRLAQWQIGENGSIYETSALYELPRIEGIQSFSLGIIGLYALHRKINTKIAFL